MSDISNEHDSGRPDRAESDSIPNLEVSGDNHDPDQDDSLIDSPVTAELISRVSPAETTSEFPEAMRATGDTDAPMGQTSALFGSQPPSRCSDRWWSPVVMVVISLISFLMMSGFMAAFAIVLVCDDVSLEMLQDPQSMEEAMGEVVRSRLGLFVSLVIPQLALVGPCLFAAVLSPVPFAQRLGLVRGRWPIWSWLAVGAVSPLVGIISGLLLSLVVEESETLKHMNEIFRNHGTNGFFLPLAFMIGVTPAFCEELLFRGYIQQRLTRSFRPWWGIVISSFLFAAFHMDWVHVLAVFPLGLFLGWATWKSGSLLPAMVGHFVNNFVSVIGIVVAPGENQDSLELPAAALSLSVFGFGLIGVATIAWVARRYKGEETEECPTVLEQSSVGQGYDQEELHGN